MCIVFNALCYSCQGKIVSDENNTGLVCLRKKQVGSLENYYLTSYLSVVLNRLYNVYGFFQQILFSECLINMLIDMLASA